MAADNQQERPEIQPDGDSVWQEAFRWFCLLILALPVLAVLVFALLMYLGYFGGFD
jgi:hypothetical protein